MPAAVVALVPVLGAIAVVIRRAATAERSHLSTGGDGRLPADRLRLAPEEEQGAAARLPSWPRGPAI